MVQTYRLVAALSDRAAKTQVFSDLRAGDPLPPVEARFWDSDRPAGGYSAYSILIGGNGTGKSRLLGSVAEALQRIERTGPAATSPGPSLARIECEVDQKRVVLSNPTLPENFATWGESCLPSRVIAVALTAFDKFPLEHRSMRDEEDDDPFYRYVGMRDRTNRASVAALLYKAIEGLAQARSQIENLRLREVFEFLGYRPKMRAVLKASIDRSLRERALGQGDLFTDNRYQTMSATRIQGLIDRGVYSENEIRGAIKYVIGIEDHKGLIDLEFDLKAQAATPKIDIRPIFMLRRLGLIRLMSVLIESAEGRDVDLRSASSGQISIFTAFLSIGSYIRDGSLILIDEPETGLHPEWQSQYVELLKSVFRSFEGCHFVISTHSPLIISDLESSDSFVYSLDRAQTISSSELSGMSPDYIMANAFDVIGPTNYYLREVLTKALRLVSDGKQEAAEYKELLAELERLSDNLEGGSQIKRAIQEMLDARKPA